MKTKRLYSGLNNSQRIRVILDGVGIYCRVKDVPSMFATTKHYHATDFALRKLDEAHGRCLLPTQPLRTTGFGTGFNGINVQVDLL